jgi:large subunit ribosomal protein L21
MSEDVAQDATEAEAPAKPSRSRSKKETPVHTGYAIVETGGKQYRVKVGDHLRVERLAADAGSEITIDKVLLIGGAGSTSIGAPLVDGASVAASVDAHVRGEKIDVFKYKAKKRYRRKIGHRQELTEITITSING